MPTGQAGYDPDDYRDIRDKDRQRQREQSSSDRQRQREEQRAEQMRQDNLEANRERLEAMRKVVNDESISIDNDMKKVINDPDTLMMDTGEIVKRSRRGLGTGQFAQQFSQLRGKSLKKRTSKKRKSLNKLQSQAFREANEKLRNNKGALRKGKTQRDVAKLAQRILKRLRK